MDKRQGEKETYSSNTQEFLTPIKGYQEASQNKSTTANLNSHEKFSFEKLINRQTVALKYCSANLNELLGSDIKFKSPANVAKHNISTPARDWDGSAFFNIVEEYDSAVKFKSHKLNLDMSIRKDPFAGHRLREEELLKDPGFYNPTPIEFNNPCRPYFAVEDNYVPRYLPYSYRMPMNSHYYSPDQSCTADDYRKRKRKNNLQLKVLKSEFSKGDNWNKEKISQVSQITGLSESQVYKWCWDQKKKVEDQDNTPRNPDSHRDQMDSSIQAAFNDLAQEGNNFRRNPSSIESSIKKRKPDRDPFSLIHNCRF